MKKTIFIYIFICLLIGIIFGIFDLDFSVIYNFILEIFLGLLIIFGIFHIFLQKLWKIHYNQKIWNANSYSVNLGFWMMIFASFVLLMWYNLDFLPKNIFENPKNILSFIFVPTFLTIIFSYLYFLKKFLWK